LQNQNDDRESRIGDLQEQLRQLSQEKDLDTSIQKNGNCLSDYVNADRIQKSEFAVSMVKEHSNEGEYRVFFYTGRKIEISRSPKIFLNYIQIYKYIM